MKRLRSCECSSRECGVCRQTFIPRKGSMGLYCSTRCANTAKSRANARLRGDSQRGRGEGRTYRKLFGRHEHRVIAEWKLGRFLLPGEIVHHIDGDKLNNHPDNLEVMTQSEHIKLHRPCDYRKRAA